MGILGIPTQYHDTAVFFVSDAGIGAESAGRDLLLQQRRALLAPRRRHLSGRRCASAFAVFICVRMRFWLAPIVVVLLLLSPLRVFVQGSAVVPFIYTLF